MAVIHRISKDNKEILVRIVSHICLILYDVFIYKFWPGYLNELGWLNYMFPLSQRPREIGQIIQPIKRPTKQQAEISQ